MGFVITMNLMLIKKYKVKEKEKWCVLNELLIWLEQNISKQRSRKIMGIEPTMDMNLLKK